jgi:NAD(P)-dependent dehydrogenase (short-subunit alcohol dehydrogenase family)
MKVSKPMRQAIHEGGARYPSLAGRPVLITGGASGIGEAMVRAFAAQGCRTAFIDVLRDKGEALARELGADVLFLPCDLTEVGALQGAMAEANARHGDLAALVNNAANDDRHRLEDVSAGYWEERVAINLKPMVFAAQAAVPQMRRRGGGVIVNLGSISWKRGMAGMVGYVTLKAAVHGLTRALARDLGPDNIRVNTLTPGWVMTERQLNLWVDEEAEREIDRMQCLPGRIEPADIAAMALFLASDDARRCTGQDFTVDAGWT